MLQTPSTNVCSLNIKTVKFLVSERQENNITSLMVEYCISVLLSNFHGPVLFKKSIMKHKRRLLQFLF